MTDGIVRIDKPAGMTSFGVVARLRRVFSKEAGKKVKVGHTGTLDPFATGLMIVVVGAECKNAMTYTKLDKTYEAVIRLGETSTTGDPEGEITKRSIISDAPTKNAVAAVIEAFRGEITQKPPVYSAIKIGGRRAYDLAREGKSIEIPERNVMIHSLEIIKYDYPDLRIRAHVGSGTYIRSLAVDIGEILGTGAYCLELRRLTVGRWVVEDAQTLADFGISS